MDEKQAETLIVAFKRLINKYTGEPSQQTAFAGGLTMEQVLVCFDKAVGEIHTQHGVTNTVEESAKALVTTKSTKKPTASPRK